MFSHLHGGMFVSNFVPTTVGGDVLRISRLSNDTGDGPHSFASVLLERLSGWIVLPVFTLGVWRSTKSSGAGRPRPGGGQHRRPHPAGSRADLAAGGNQRFGRLVSRRDGWVRFVNGLHMGIDELRAKPRDTGRVLITAFAYQAIMLAAAGVRQGGGDRRPGAHRVDGVHPCRAHYPGAAHRAGGARPAGRRVGSLPPRPGRDRRAGHRHGLLLYFLTVAGSLVGLPTLVFGGRHWQRASRSRHGR